MCIAYLALEAHPDWPLFIAANRDEVHQRASLAAAPWKSHPDVIAGIDLHGGGTWLGVTHHGRYGLLTNYREAGIHLEAAPSRGELVSNFLTSSVPPADYVETIRQSAKLYNGFNLIVGDLTNSWYVSNRAPEPNTQSLGQGRYVISNHLLDTPWPKAERLRQAFEKLAMDSLTHSLPAIFAILKDTTPADDTQLPCTGLSREQERLLSSPFIISPDYGTRCSTIIAVHKDGQGILSEASYDAAGTMTQRHDWPFKIT